MSGDIREATQDDMVLIAEMAEEFYKLGKLDVMNFGFNLHSFIDFLLQVSNSDLGCVFSCSKGGILLGSIAGLIYPWYLDMSQKHASVLWWCVNQKQRTGRLGKHLLDRFELWAKEQGAVRVFSRAINKDNSNKMKRLHAMFHYYPTEIVYSKELRNGN